MITFRDDLLITVVIIFISFPLGSFYLHGKRARHNSGTSSRSNGGIARLLLINWET